MKRTPLHRRTPIERSARVNPRRAQPRRVSVVRDPAYRAAIRELDYCAAANLPNAGPCWGRLECAHLGRRNGMGSKGSDHETGPLCTGHHQDQEADTGPFVGYSREQMLAWGLKAAARARAIIDYRRANTIGRRTEGV